jgi:hypothetical protein
MWIRLKTAPLDSLKHKKALFLSDRKGRWISFGQILSNFRGATQIAFIPISLKLCLKYDIIIFLKFSFGFS